MKSNSFAAELARAEFHRAELNRSPSFELALHTSKPTGDDQSSNELALSGYARVTVLRNELTWRVAGRTVMNNLKVAFPTITSGRTPITHLSIGIGGTIRRLIELPDGTEVKANFRPEFEPGDIAITEE